MTREEFRQLTERKIVILDGATGSNLIKAGLKNGECPELFILRNPDILLELQREYVNAGCDILYAPTFSGNRIKLAEYGIEDRLAEINSELVRLSKEAAAGKAYVAGDLTMTGRSLAPVGDLGFEELVDIYKEQAGVMLMAGVDLFVVETMMSLSECRAAVIAIKEICELPVMVTLTFGEDGKTLYGTDPQTAMIVLQGLGADAVGVNCSQGPESMADIVSAMNRVAKIPVIAKPNAGLPKLVDGVTEYEMGPMEFALGMRKVIEAGAGIVGGCCGTTPKHLEELCEMTESLDIDKVKRSRAEGRLKSYRALTNERRSLVFGLSDGFKIIGERINPTGKAALQEQLRNKRYDLVCEMAMEEEELGADILDVNVGMNGIDEKETMLNVINELTMAVNLPLSIDTSHADIMEEALRVYPGRALINSICYDPDKLPRLLAAAKKYGAMFILLPLSEKGLPKDMEERLEFIRLIREEAHKAGLCDDDIIVDGLVNTVGARKQAALDTLSTIDFCKNELGLATTCGLSNISFGLPERPTVNAAFLTMAIENGLTTAIMNPSQTLLMNMAKASDMLLNIEGADVSYINRVNEHPLSLGKNDKAGTVKKGGRTDSDKGKVYSDVIMGNKRGIVDSVKDELKNGRKPGQIIDELLIPAINKVGELFDKQEYFLPQLISSANAMKTAIEFLEPMLDKNDSDNAKITIVMATVEGDIHDIGKNLVVLMLKNYGYNVIDLGKDVPAEKIIGCAKENDAAIIGLSALMTTTMMQMKKVVELAKTQVPGCHVIIGGAVTTQDFADEIEANGYSKDAQEAVELVKRLLGAK